MRAAQLASHLLLQNYLHVFLQKSAGLHLDGPHLRAM